MTGHDPLEEYLQNLTRRRFFGAMSSTLTGGLGATALSSLLTEGAMAAAPGVEQLLQSLPHHAPKAKRIIYMHMEGGPSQIDLWDHKPGLRQRFDADLPDSIRKGQRITTMTSGQDRLPVAPSMFNFKRYDNNENGVQISELMPHTAAMSKDICFIHSMHTQAINHEPGITFFQTGQEQPGRPSFGSWMSYGLGAETENLPAFVVMISQGFGNTQALSARFWGSGFLPSEHQGCQLRAGRDAVLHLRDPDGVSREDRRRMLDLASDINQAEYERSGDEAALSRIAQAEMAYRMQMSVPELTDISGESKETLEMYGSEVHTPGSFAANCLRARRLAERGVRFIQLYQRGWDQHNNLPSEIRQQCNAVDQAQAALLQDLKQRGMLDDTLVLWAGEFGRTVYSQGTLTAENYGRDHHPRCFTVWLAGGGIKPGITYGNSCDFSYNIAENPVTAHDLHATILHCMGIDHERLTFRSRGLDFKLTGVEAANPITDILG